MVGSRKLIVHCSDSAFGCAILINKWHLERGFDSIGYHFTILNGYPYSKKQQFFFLDGAIEVGRKFNARGAHCRGHNGAIGVCLIGNDNTGFTTNQYLSLQKLIISLKVNPEDVYGHCEFDKNKTCPCFDVRAWRRIYL